MDISRKTDYAIRMIAELVKAEGNIVSVRHAAEANQIPYSFARSIQHDLVAAGLITSVRGSHGGMLLAIDPKTTTVRYVVEAVQGPTFRKRALSETANVPRGFMIIWAEADRLLRDFLDSVTLHEAVMEERCPVLVEGHNFVTLDEAGRQALGMDM